MFLLVWPILDAVVFNKAIFFGEDKGGWPQRFPSSDSAQSAKSFSYSPSHESKIDILIPDAESAHTQDVIRSLSLNPRWRIHLAFARDRPAASWSRHVTSFFQYAGREVAGPSEILTAVRFIGPAIVVPVSQEGAQACFAIRRSLEDITSLAPLASESSYRLAVDKARLAEFMRAEAVPHPRSYSPSAQNPDLVFPLLIKPRHLGGGRGIQCVFSLQELDSALLSRGNCESLFLQEFIPGDDVGCSVLAVDGLIVASTTQRGKRTAPGYSPFSEIDLVDEPEALKVVKRLMSLLKWTGVAHVDLRIDERTGKPLVLEVNARYWGSLMASTTAGVNFPDLACRTALGEKLPTTCQRNGTYLRFGKFLSDAIRLRSTAFRPHRSALPFIAADPLPTIHRLWFRRPEM